MSGESFGRYLKRALGEKLIGLSNLNLAVERIFRLKVELGLFERPYVDPAMAERVIGQQSHREMARQVARVGKHDFGEGTIDLKTGAVVVTDTSYSVIWDCGEGFDHTQ